MPLGSFARYAAQNVFRNKRRTFAVLIGTLLAVTLVAGENIAIDTTASSVLNEMLEDVAYDFEGFSHDLDEVVNGTNALAGVNNVEHAEPVVTVGIVEVPRESDSLHHGFVHAVMPSIVDVADKFGFVTNPSVPSGHVVLTERFASLVGVGVGENLTMRVSTFNMTGPVDHYLNLTVAKVVMMEDPDDELGISIIYRFNFEILVNFHDLDFILSNLPFEDWGPFQLETHFFIWVDRDELIRPGDPGKTNELLERMKRDLNWAGSPYGITVFESELSMIVEGFNMWLTVYRALFLALALPAIVLGVYLSIIGSEMGLGERRREIGIFKARGSTNRQILGLLIIEAVIMGIIAGVLGLFFGALTSSLFSVLTPYGLRQSFLELTITEFTIVLSIVTAVVLLLIATYRPAKRFSALPVTETLQKYSAEEATVRYKPTRDLIFIGLAVFNYVGLLLLRDFAAGETPMVAVMCFLLPIVIVLTPFAPFFLVIGVTSFLTRFTTKIYSWTARATKALTKDLYDIVNKNITRNPKRASSVCVLIAMGLAFGVIVSTMAETQSAHIERTLHSQIGGDMTLTAWSVNRSFANQIEYVDGVEKVAEATLLVGNLGSWGLGAGVWAIDSSAYWDVVHPDEYFFKEGGPRSTISSLRTYGNVIVNQEFADQNYVRVDDQIPITVESSFVDENESWSTDSDDYLFRVVGIAKVMPGFASGGVGIWQEGEIYVDYLSVNLTKFGNQSMNFFIDAEDGRDPSEVRDNVVEAFPEIEDAGHIRVYEEELEEARSDPFTGALFNFLVVEFAFALLIIGVGLGLIMYVAATEREGEFASIMSRGASSKQVTNLLLGEAFTIMIIGVVIGIVTGLITAFVFNELLSFAMTGGGQGALDMPLVVSYQTIGLILLTIVILVIASLLASLKIRRIDLPTALRRRGG